MFALQLFVYVSILDAGLSFDLVLIVLVSIGLAMLALKLAALASNNILGPLSAFAALHLLFVQSGLTVIAIGVRSGNVHRLALGIDVSGSFRPSVLGWVGLLSIMGAALASGGRRRVPVKPLKALASRLGATEAPPVAKVVWTMGLILSIGAFVYSLAGQVASGGINLALISDLSGAQSSRLDYYYRTNPGFLFDSSVVSQAYGIVLPYFAFAGLICARGTYANRVGRLAAFMLMAVMLTLLQRTSIVVLALWLVTVSRSGSTEAGNNKRLKDRRSSALAIFGGGGLYLLITAARFVGGSVSWLEIFERQVLRRITLVNSGVASFIFTHYGDDVDFRAGDTYSGYVGAIVGAGESFSHQVFAEMFASSRRGTAPAGVIPELWANFGAFFVVGCLIAGVLLQWTDRQARRWSATGSPLGRSFAGGLTVLVATAAYTPLMALLFSGGIVGLYLLNRTMIAMNRRAYRVKGNAKPSPQLEPI